MALQEGLSLARQLCSGLTGELLLPTALNAKCIPRIWGNNSFISREIQVACTAPTTALSKVAQQMNFLRSKNRADGVSVLDMQKRKERGTRTVNPHAQSPPFACCGQDPAWVLCDGIQRYKQCDPALEKENETQAQTSMVRSSVLQQRRAQGEKRGEGSFQLGE